MSNESIGHDFRKVVVIFVVTFAATAGTPSQTRNDSATEPSTIERTNAILISQYMIRTGSEALLITDPEKISELVRLFTNNRTAPHACAYHWLIWFRQSATRSIPFSHNEECEIYANHDKQIHLLLNAYFRAIKQNPTQFILNIKVPASLEPDEAVRKLEDNKQKVFFFSETEQRLPYIRIQASAISNIPKNRSEWDAAESKNLSLAEDRLRNAIAALRSKYTIVKTTKLDNRYSRFGGGTMEHRVETTIYFPIGTTVDNIGVPSGVDVLDRKMPGYYILQLVVQERFSEAFRRSLMSSNPFILDVHPFPNFQ